MRNPATVNWAGVADIVFRKLNPDAGPEDSDFPRVAECCDCHSPFQQNGIKHVRCRPCNRIEWQKRAQAAAMRQR